MNTKLIISNLFVYSQKANKYFYTEFCDGVNVIYGKNTSGKSTVFQSILYTFGINDNNDYLKEILVDDMVFRIDCRVIKNDITKNVIIIRDDETIYIKEGNTLTLRFDGISGDKSFEHIKLKDYLSKLFGFSLKLESKNEYKSAPIETMFLPYYISQSVGWVYLQKSFSNLDFYKHFKEDYLDYYLGVESSVDRVKKNELEAKLRSIEEKIDFFTKFEENNDEFQLTKLADEQFVEESLQYIETHKDNQELLNKDEQDYISKCNKQSFYKRRASLLRNISKHHENQNPLGGVCPSCNQKLNFNIAAAYMHFQEENDTNAQLKICKEKIKSLQSEINSLKKSINARESNVSKEYQILRKYFSLNISYDSWLKNKVNSKLIVDIKCKIGELTTNAMRIKDNLNAFKTEEEVQKYRSTKSKEFETIFLGFLDQLGVKPLEEDRYKMIYRISAFPSQGVELHKTVLAYNFAFNKLIEMTDNLQRFPFMLDAIFKEDIEESNKDTIVGFIGRNKPNDTQLILSIAETKETDNSVFDFNNKYFNKKAKLICIGKGVKERAFLDIYNGSQNALLEETVNIINGEDH